VHKPGKTNPKPPWLRRDAGRAITVALAILTVLGPLYLFWDPLSSYRLHGDDFAYVGASRSLARTRENLFRPHNTHIVPAWRVLTWGAVAWAGKLASVEKVLGVLAFAILALTVLATGWVVGRETKRPAAGLAAMAFAGTTWVMHAAATWYSAGQTLWAVFGILMTLVCVQGWRQSGGIWRLAMSAVWAVLAGGFWTVGHIAGPAAAAYLLADGRPAPRRAAIVPFLASVLAVAVSFSLGGKNIQTDVRFDAKDKHAVNVPMGISHTLQAIPETLVFGNLGLAPEMTPAQGVVLSAAILAFWAWSFRRGGRPSPLEMAGGVIVLGSSLIEWTFRGYLPYTSLRGVVPWYHTIPHLGAVLFVAGWWSRVWNAEDSPGRNQLTWAGALGIVALEIALIVVHQPRADVLFVNDVPIRADELADYPTLELKRIRASVMAGMLSDWHRRYLARLDQAEVVARRQGIGLDAIRATFGRIDAPGLPASYDAADVLDLPREGRITDPALVRQALARYFLLEPEPSMPSAREAMESLRR
jgi:hypothetical protein